MLSFTELERAALEAIGRQHPDDRAALQAQLAMARVVRRENSGAGFFTDLAIDEAAPRVTSRHRVLGNVGATVDGFDAPLLLMLFMRDGFAEMLEGAACGDSTVGVNLEALRFDLVPG